MVFERSRCGGALQCPFGIHVAIGGLACGAAAMDSPVLEGEQRPGPPRLFSDRVSGGSYRNDAMGLVRRDRNLQSVPRASVWVLHALARVREDRQRRLARDE